MKFAAEWFRDRIGLGGFLENDPNFAAYLESVPKFQEAIRYSRRFYQLQLDDPVDSDDAKGTLESVG